MLQLLSLPTVSDPSTPACQALHTTVLWRTRLVLVPRCRTPPTRSMVRTPCLLVKVNSHYRISRLAFGSSSSSGI